MTPKRGINFKPKSRRVGSEDGATAILIALLTLFVLLPLAGLSTTAFIRAATVAELSMAADAGALAGASSIPVLQIDLVDDYINLVDDQVPDNDAIDELIRQARPNAAQDPRQIACEQATKALTSNGRIGNAFDSGDPITCFADYLDETDFVTEFGRCVAPATASATDPYLTGVRNSLPGLLRPGLKVTMTRGVTPPLEPLVGVANSEHHAESYARRRFKNAIVLPIVVIAPIEGVDLDDVPLNPLVELTQEQVLDALETVDEAIDTFNATPEPPLPPLPDFSSDCRGVLPALADDIEDLVNPPEGGPTSEEVLDEADATGSEVQVLRLFGFTPFFDFVPVCVNRIGPDSFEEIDCVANAPGAFRAALVPASP